MNPQTRKAVSPVIATVILVAVAITVSVGVSYWMGGISSQYTQFEKVEIQTGYATYDAAEGWTVTMSLKNSGSATATITHIFINDAPVLLAAAAKTGFGVGATEVGPGTIGASIPDTGLTLTAGVSSNLVVYISNAAPITLTSGTTVNIKLHSAGGMDYIKLIRLP